MRRFIATYRWELWLIGISCTAAVVREFWSGAAVLSVLAAVLLGVSYIRVRRLERDLLPLVWGYFLTIAIITASAANAPADLKVGLPASWIDLLQPPWFSPWAPSWLALLPELLALFWFARRASRLSLAHAFFLAGFMFTPVSHVLYTLFVNLDVSPVQPSPSNNALFHATWTLAAAATAASLLKVWLLGNFDSRGRVFRRNAIVVHLAVAITLPSVGFAAFYLVAPRVYLLLVLLTVVWWAGVLALIYLVRVRQPAPAPFPTPRSEHR